MAGYVIIIKTKHMFKLLTLVSKDWTLKYIKKAYVYYLINHFFLEILTDRFYKTCLIEMFTVG